MATMPDLGGMDAAKAAGVLVIGALVILVALRKSFAGVRVGISD